ncbi:MAG TPA: polyprenyl synthetase family protein [Longilinea sp.]|nr:polyprenyl synthetase family protein [Longilinea sp.]
MTLSQYSKEILPAIEKALQDSVAGFFLDKRYENLRRMMAYHLGWEGAGSGLTAQGKRIRPQVVLLCCEAAGGKWQNALPAAAAIELIHNFSLIHDDIEDHSDLRHGRMTIWAKWGEAQAVNTGDAMFTLANLTLMDLKNTLPADKVLAAMELLQRTCFDLTRGQFLDISYEGKKSIQLRDYWPMIGGKTAALLASSAQLGALIGEANEAQQKAFYHFGYSLGLAFQAQDDVLGIWGDDAFLGKSTKSDLVNGKKTLPVLYALNNNGPFAKRWWSGPLKSGEIASLAEQLRLEGAKEYCLAQVDRLTGEALSALNDAIHESEARKTLYELAMNLLQRTY